MAKLIHTVLEKFSEFLFPERCAGCGRAGTQLCEDCRQKTRETNFPSFSPPELTRLWWWGSYANPALRRALRRFKYHGTSGLKEPFARMLAEVIAPELNGRNSRELLIIPIPLAKSRLGERGYNQAGLLAEGLSQELTLPLSLAHLIKTKSTPSQTSLSGNERLKNVRNSFAIHAPEELKGKTVILVDDIATTGATMSEAARVLKKAGVGEVIGLVVARG